MAKAFTFSDEITEMRRAARVRAKTIGPELRAKRVAAGIKQGYIADKLGVTASQLSMMEKGKRLWHDDQIAKFRQLVGETTTTNNKKGSNAK